MFLGIIAEIINYLFSLVFSLIYNIAKIGMMLIGYSSHVDARSAWIENSWYKSLALVDFLIVFMVIILALAYALRWNIETYEVKKTLPSVIGGFIAAHFSMLFIRGALDFAEILTKYFMGDSSGENIALKLMRLCTGVDFEQLNSFMIHFDYKSSTSIGFLQTVPLLAGLGILAGGGVIAIPILIIFLFLVLLPVILLFGIGLVLLLRKIVLTILIICSPIIIILYFFPPTKSYGQQYMTALFQWIFLAPIVLLLLSIATYFGPGTENKITYLQDAKHIVAYLFDYHGWVAIAHAAPSPSATPITAGNYGAIENFIQGWINWIAGVLIMFMALTLPFQMGGIGSQIIKGLGDLSKKGMGYFKDRTAIPELIQKGWSGTPMAKWDQGIKAQKDMIKADTDATNKKLQKEVYLKMEQDMIGRGLDSGTPQRVALARQMRSLFSEDEKKFENYSAASLQAEYAGWDKNKQERFQLFKDGKAAPGMDVAERGEFGALAAIMHKRAVSSYDPEERKMAQKWLDDNVGEHNQDWYGAPKTKDQSYDTAVYQACKKFETSPANRNNLTQDEIYQHVINGSTPTGMTANDFDQAINNFAKDSVGKTAEYKEAAFAQVAANKGLNIDNIRNSYNNGDKNMKDLVNKAIADIKNSDTNITIDNFRTRIRANIVNRAKGFYDIRPEFDINGMERIQEQMKKGNIDEVKRLGRQHNLAFITENFANAKELNKQQEIIATVNEMIKAKRIYQNPAFNNSTIKCDEFERDRINTMPDGSPSKEITTAIHRNLTERVNSVINYTRTNPVDISISSFQASDISKQKEYKDVFEKIDVFTKDLQDKNKYSQAFIEQLFTKSELEKATKSGVLDRQELFNPKNKIVNKEDLAARLHFINKGLNP